MCQPHAAESPSAHAAIRSLMPMSGRVLSYDPPVLHELWEDPGSEGRYRFCLAGPHGDQARSMLSSSARLTWSVEADSHFQAMTLYYEHMDWGTYTTDQGGTVAPSPSRVGVAPLPPDHAALRAAALARPCRSEATRPVIGVQSQSPAAPGSLGGMGSLIPASWRSTCSRASRMARSSMACRRW